ncbi:cytochrome P450 [Periconia macrospinosa]|uniref:Cytochrome P450 n=1 Tax=Periconia macrospinosa TaxID=97972 RepID=A0A2V1DDA3_9PLEO|nr:cytochrome P450 [Periconia macrospinosa]
MPEHHLIFGHFIVLKECIQALPRNTTMHVVVRHMARRFSNGVFCLNLWPFNMAVFIISDPVLASQVEAAFLDKPEAICTTMEVISGGPSLMTMYGNTWKKWRGLFNAGFAAGYVIGLAPAIADEVAVFCNLLQDRTKAGTMFQLEEYTLRFTFDVIGRVTLDARLHYQTQGSALADCLRRQVYWTPFGTTFNPFRRYLSPRPVVQKYNSYRMNQYLDEEIDKRGSIIEGGFQKMAKPQLRMFLYAGHDTKSSTLLYCFILLHRHQKFSPKSELNTTKFSALNPLSSIHKEVLRIFPPAATLREGRSDLVLVDDKDRQYPTRGCNIWVLDLAMHHCEDVFLKASRRALEWGPRSCIGQSLAQLELKVALVMKARMFDIAPAGGNMTVDGNRVYQAEMGGGGAHPVDGFPVRVTSRV